MTISQRKKRIETNHKKQSKKKKERIESDHQHHTDNHHRNDHHLCNHHSSRSPFHKGEKEMKKKCI